MIAVRLLYGGRVQGVGFRATCARFARDFAVSGWVRNLPSGEVELLVEGDSSEVEAFLERITVRFRDNIDSTRSEPVSVTGHKSFEIWP
jgi:acylphosphatase